MAFSKSVVLGCHTGHLQRNCPCPEIIYRVSVCVHPWFSDIEKDIQGLFSRELIKPWVVALTLNFLITKLVCIPLDVCDY
jgi:hypothetical protein